MTTEELKRFIAKLEILEDGCWFWNGGRGGKPPYWYGVFKASGIYTTAHRHSYEHFVGPIPAGMVIDHLCGIKLCVNPDHLRICTQRNNLHASPTTLNSKNMALTHCKNGHLLSGDNVRMYRNQRVCRACKREWRARKRKTT